MKLFVTTQHHVIIITTKLLQTTIFTNIIKNTQNHSLQHTLPPTTHILPYIN